MTTRSMAREVLAGPFTLHPKALRAIGVVVPDAGPALAPCSEPTEPYHPSWVLPCTPDWDYDDYSPTSPRCSQ